MDALCIVTKQRTVKMPQEIELLEPSFDAMTFEDMNAIIEGVRNAHY